jgi:hypothetical protein
MNRLGITALTAHGREMYHSVNRVLWDELDAMYNTNNNPRILMLPSTSCAV